MFGTCSYCCWSILFCFTALSVTSFSIRKKASKLRSDSTFQIADPTRLLSDLFGSFYKSSNVRGGNSKFQYFAPRNYREVYIYQLSQFEEKLKNSTFGSMLPANVGEKSIIREVVNSQIPANLKDNPATKLELSAILDKDVFIICKWAIPLPPSFIPLGTLEQCSQPELKSVLEQK